MFDDFINKKIDCCPKCGSKKIEILGLFSPKSGGKYYYLFICKDCLKKFKI